MWQLIEKPKSCRVTKALAREFVTMEKVPEDRALQPKRLEGYRKQLANGTFRPVSWAKCFCKETGITYRVNGKHTSTLLDSLDTIPEMYTTVESYEADTLADVARLYSTFDSRSQLRTASDINLSFAGSVPELADVPRNTINLIVAALSYAVVQDGSGKMPPAERAEKLLEHVDFALWASNILHGGENGKAAQHMRRAAVVAAMLLTYLKSRKDATTFWIAIRDETGDSPSLPDRKLARWLATMSVTKGGWSTRVASKLATPREFFVKALHAWNAWRKGTTTDLKYYADAKVPSVA